MSRHDICPRDDASNAAASQVEPAADAAPGAVADELLAHGLLAYLHHDDPAVQTERVARVMTAIGADAYPGRRLLFPAQRLRAWSAAAACIGLLTAVTYLGFPGVQTAQAMVEVSVAAMRTAGDHRFEVRIQAPSDTSLPTEPNAVVDTRSPNLMLLRARNPQGGEVVAGRDSTGDWAIRRDGGIERRHPEVAWPRWAKVGEESLFANSVDKLLDELTKGYFLQYPADTRLDGRGETLFRHIVGTKKRDRGPGGDRVEIWIDPSTSIVERLEMSWTPPPGPPEGQPGARPHDSQRGAADDGAPAPGPRRPLPPDDDAPPPPPHPEDGPPGAGAGPDDDGMSPDDRPRPPRTPHRRPPPPPPPPPGLGPMGGPMEGPIDGPPPHGGPAGPDRPGRGERHGPPKLLVMQRVDAPTYADGWFGPESHLSK